MITQKHSEVPLEGWRHDYPEMSRKAEDPPGGRHPALIPFLWFKYMMMSTPSTCSGARNAWAQTPEHDLVWLHRERDNGCVKANGVVGPRLSYWSMGPQTGR